MLCSGFLASAQAEVRDTVVVFICAFHCIDSFYAENVEFSLPMNGYTCLLPAAASRLNMTNQTSRLRHDALFWVSCLPWPNSVETAGRRHYTLLSVYIS